MQYRSLTQIIVEVLRERIFSGECAPGSRLNIADLAQSFKVSPVPVREALRNLETEGLVQFHLNRGVVVRELSAAEVRELFLIRSRLEALAGSEAARWVDDAVLGTLDGILRDMDAAGLGTPTWDTLHGRFHDVYYETSRLPRLIQLVKLLRGQMRPYAKIYLSNPDHLAAAQREHHALVEALRRRDTAEIERLTYEHLMRPARLALGALPQSDMGDIESG